MLRPQINAYRYEAACDEAGRGALAGPVFAAAVVFPKDFSLAELNDSKQLDAEQRTRLAKQIKDHSLGWAVAWVNAKNIDKINILQASILAMHKSLERIHCPIEHIAIDGNYFKSYKNIPHTCVVKGDEQFQHIAAASILAKTTRDAYMIRMHKQYPQYQWYQNKGYPTRVHRQAIGIYGKTSRHRLSFLCRN